MTVRVLETPDSDGGGRRRGGGKARAAANHLLLAAACLPTACLSSAFAQTPPQAQQQTAQQTTADRLIAHGHYLRAWPLVKAQLAKNPKDIPALVDEATLQWAFNHTNAFLAGARKAVAADEASAAAHAQVANALGWELANSTSSFITKLGAATEYRKEVGRTLQLDPNNTDELRGLAEYEWHAPGIAGGDKAKAQQEAEKLMRIDPERGYELKAEFAAGNGDKSGAKAEVEAVWKQAVAALPSSYRAHAGLAEAYLDEGGQKLALAEQEADKAAAIDPTRVAAYRVLAEVDAMQGKWADLEQVLKRARAEVPDDLSPEYQAARLIVEGNVEAQMGRAEGYLRDYMNQPAEGQEPTLAAAHWRLGLVLERQGRKGEAVNEVQTAANLDGSLDGAKKDLKRMR